MLPGSPEGLKGTLAYNVGKRDALGSLTVDRKLGGYDLNLKAQYQQAGRAFTLQASAAAAAAAPCACEPCWPACCP